MDDGGMPSDVDEVEWLDAEPPPDPAPWRLPPRAWYLLVGGVAIAVVLVLGLTRYQARHTATSTLAPTPSPSQSPAPVSVIELGRAPMNLPSTWRLVARGYDAVYVIQVATGRTTRTS